MTEARLPLPEREPKPKLPRAYFASLADYNHMVLHGAWVEDLGDPDHVHAEIQKMLEASEEAVAEEWAIHDYEGFGEWSPHEYTKLDELVDSTTAAPVVFRCLAVVQTLELSSTHQTEARDIMQQLMITLTQVASEIFELAMPNASTPTHR